MNNNINLAEIRNDNDNDSLLRADLSNWKKNALEVTAHFPKGVNFFLAECYFRSSAVENEPLLLALLSESTTIQALTERRFCQPTAVSEIVDGDVGEIRFRFVTHSYPFLFAEQVLAPLCQDPETALCTRFVNAKKKGFSEKRICRDDPQVRSNAYWGMKRKADLPMQLWAYDLAQCDPELKEQTYSRKVFPILTADHMTEYQKTGKIYEDKDYQFFLDGKYSYIDLSRSWSALQDLESDWEELNAHVGSSFQGEESCK
jgi:hypothetical protein